MKKILAVLTALTLCAFALAGCGSQNPNGGSPAAGTTGEPEAPAASPNEIIIDGTAYALPVPVSVFTENGWELIGAEKFEEEYEPGDTQAPGSTGLKQSDSDKFFITYAYNDSEAAKPLSECDILGIQFSLSVAKDSKVELPYGITNESTYDEIIEAYGDPESSDKFEKGRKDDNRLAYDKDKETGYNYSFSFEEDGTLSSFTVRASVPEAE